MSLICCCTYAVETAQSVDPQFIYIYTYAKKYKAQVDFNTRLFDKPFRPYKISVLKEEYDAWDRGLALAKRLKIDIDEEKYYNYASKFLYTYCKWVVSRRRNV